MPERKTVVESSGPVAVNPRPTSGRVAFTVLRRDIPVHDAGARARLEAAAKNPNPNHDFPNIPLL